MKGERDVSPGGTRIPPRHPAANTLLDTLPSRRSINDIAQCLGISASTVHREWMRAKIWLYLRLKKVGAVEV